MNKNTATADVFITAFRALPKIQREAVISGLLEDRRIAEDILDILLIEDSRNERGRDITLEDYAASRKKR